MYQIVHLIALMNRLTILGAGSATPAPSLKGGTPESRPFYLLKNLRYGTQN